MEAAKAILKKYWGYDDFRSLQGEVISSVLAGNDTVALLHTGAGKSLCYQLPSLVFEGKTVVISPLIALMQDQVSGLIARGINAKAIYAGMSAREVDLTIDNFVHGPIKILYVSPERAGTDIFLDRFARADISLIAVDEAHCISQWGYDFRPSYFNISQLRELKPNVPIIAVTATATGQVVEDIKKKLELRKTNVIVSTFERDNISLSIMITESKDKMLLDLLQKMSGVGIIYMRSRKKVKHLTEWLGKRGINASYYHGGLPMKTRKKIQDKWQHSKDGLIICTNAFGMGVDKPDVRFVIHLDVPPSIEEYYQEAGRAGRDGNPSYAISIISHGDIMRLDYNILLSYPPIEEISAVYQKLCSFLKVAYGSGEMETYRFDFEAFCDRFDLRQSKIHSILSLLEKEGWLQFNDGYKNPSTLLITADKNDVVNYSKKSDMRSKIMMQIVRNYEGLFIDHTPIDEEKLAEELHIELKSLIKEIKLMHKLDLIHYVQSVEGPRVTFLRPRMEPGAFGIDNKMYKFRAERAKVRRSAMTAYILSDSCRQQQLLTYFEEESGPCGRCDICKGSAVTFFTQEEKEKVRQHILKRMTANKLHLEEYLLRWPYNKRAKAKACVLALETEGYFRIDDHDRITLLTK